MVETASSLSLPSDQQTLHIIEQEFTIDGQEGIKKPLGMSGMKLEVEDVRRTTVAGDAPTVAQEAAE